MISSSALSDLLKKVISNGIETVFICRISGEILCIEGKDSDQTIADLISSMWIEYYQIGESTLKDEKWMFSWFNNIQNWVDAVNELKPGAFLDQKYVIFYQENFYDWCTRLLKGD